ncbi:MAG: multicopper oxidase family protein [Pseudomonadales bacterium]|nr:multicopper oxidase family protein [Pseudomonadales bacterium]
MKKIRVNVAAGFLFITFMSLSLYVSSAEVSQSAVTAYKQYLHKGFKPTGKTKIFSITADESILNIVPGKTTSVWAYNQKVPGPIIRVNRGDRLKVSFKNELPQPTSIHWHGVRVPNNMDGVPGVTQDQIAPGQRFEYEFVLKDSGTYWFHPHVRSFEQIERGLYGVIIVESESDPEYDQEFVLVIDDWLLNDKGELVDSFDVHAGDLDRKGRLGNYITVNGQRKPQFKVMAGQRVRLRIVNASNARNYRLQIPDTQARVFAVDGNLVGTPLVLSTIDLAPGNRLDVDITIPFGKSNIIASNLFYHREAEDGVSEGPESLFEIVVSGKVSNTKDFSPPTDDSVPRWKDVDLSSDSIVYDFDMSVNWKALVTKSPWLFFTINGDKYGDHEPTPLRMNKFYRMKFINGTRLYHPVHIHGMFFKVLKRDGEIVDEPYFRDTVLLDYKGSVEVGVVPVDEGRWMLHCHLLEHSALGMMTVVEVSK